MSLTRPLPGALLGSILSLSLSFVVGCAKEETPPAPAPDEVAPAATDEAPAATPSQRPLPRLESPTAPAPSARAGDPGSRWRGDRGDRGGRRGGRMMERFDQNGDGQLDDAERTAMMQGRAARMIERNDTDGDGSLSKAELEAIQGPGRRFLGADSGVDANGDGTITAAELEAGMSARMRERRAPEQQGAEAPAPAQAP